MKLASWNVNGIRAAHAGGFGAWFDALAADVVCVQETRALPEQVAEELRNPGRYHGFWHAAEKKGYSGVALFSRREPLELQQGLGEPRFDREGRVLIARYPELTLINAYFPNAQRGGVRLAYKLAFCAAMLAECRKRARRGENVLLCGDFNIAHTELDLANPKANQKNAGFLPEERAWMSALLAAGYVDTFRRFEKAGGHYTWWSQRFGVREKNIGWRLDGFVASASLADRLKACTHQTQVRGSDHCPVVLELER